MNLIELKAYFKTIADTHTQIESFQYGGLKRILSRNEFPDLKFPLLFLEKPSFKFTGDNQNVLGTPHAAFVILKNAKVGSPSDQDTVEQDMYQIALDIIAKMNKDRYDNVLSWFTPNGSTLDPIDTITLDGDIGWRYEFALSNPVDLCFNPLKWTV